MAEGRSVRENNVVCRYFMSSSCRDGDRCHLSHDGTRGIADSICRYYLRGKCAYGKNCRYEHVRINKQDNSKSHSHDDGHSRHSTNRESRGTVDSVCRHYLQGRCIYGKNCRYDHVRVDREGNSNSHLHNDGHQAGASRHSTNLDTTPSNYTRSESKKRNMHHPKFNVLSQSNSNKKENIPHEKKKVHGKQCEKDLEKDMAIAVAIQRSMDKACGICMDVVLEKEHFSERKFGILEKCNHVYCFSCISKWRKCNQQQHMDYALDSGITKACPECRIVSELVTPSKYFVDTEEEKEKLIREYKKSSKKNCKYFKKGKGTCIFGDACLYLHAKPNHPIPRQQNVDFDFDHVYRQFLSDIDPYFLNDELYYSDDESDYTTDDDMMNMNCLLDATYLLNLIDCESEDDLEYYM